MALIQPSEWLQYLEDVNIYDVNTNILCYPIYQGAVREFRSEKNVKGAEFNLLDISLRLREAQHDYKEM